MTRLMRRFLCRMGSHKRLHVIQTFGAAQHVGCPDCGREFAMHHGFRAFVPWSDDAEEMYRMFGYDIDGPRNRWRAALKEGRDE